MNKVNQFGAHLLLVILLAGGITAPLVHRIEHARDQQLHQQDPFGEDGHVHSDLPGLSEAPRDFIHLDVECFLCSGLSAYSIAQRFVEVTLVWEQESFPDTPAFTPASLLCPSFVRGPPVFA